MSKNDKERIEFSAIIGNPPYQTDTRKDKGTNGKGNNIPITNVFHYFQQVADLCGAKYSSLIYPAKRWINKSGKGMPEFGKEQLNDKHLKRLAVFENAADIFPGVGIGDGISIVFKDFQKDYDKIELIVNESEKTFVDHPGDSDLILNTTADSIVKKVDKFIEDNKLKVVSDSIGFRKLFGIESNFAEENPDKVRLYEKGEKLGPNEVKLYTNDKSGSAGKPTWFILKDKNLLAKNSIKFINRYKVIVSSAHAVDNSRKLEILDNNSAFGRARLLLKDFGTKKEAENFYLYCKSEIVRFLFGLSTEGLSGTGNKVPDILDYTNSCKLIDFKKDIDIQLIQHLGITAEEMDYMKNNTRISKNN